MSLRFGFIILGVEDFECCFALCYSFLPRRTQRNYLLPLSSCQPLARILFFLFLPQFKMKHIAGDGISAAGDGFPFFHFLPGGDINFVQMSVDVR